MIRIEKPQCLEQAKIIDSLVSNMHKSDWRDRVIASKNDIVSQSLQYRAYAETGTLILFSPHDVLPGGATKEDMKKLYEQKFVKKDQPGRKIYNKIIAAAPNGKCPYCGHRSVSTLDHFLPKAQYPTFAVTPENLVPSCRDCHSQKLDSVYQSKEDEPIHPYYDDFETDIWIRATMIYGEGSFFVFYAQGPSYWSEEKQLRAEKHFSGFNLDKGLFRSLAAERWPYFQSKIMRVYQRGGEEAAIQLLADELSDLQQIRMNGWEQAMVQAIIDCKEFWAQLKNV